MDKTYTVLTHLGNILQPGDTVLGYDLLHAVLGLQQENSLKALQHAADRPDVILVKKVYPEKERKPKKKKARIPPWRKNRSSNVDGNEENTSGKVVKFKEEDHVEALAPTENGEEEEEFFNGEGGDDDMESIDEEFEELLEHLQEEKEQNIEENEFYDEGFDNEGDEENNVDDGDDKEKYIEN